MPTKESRQFKLVVWTTTLAAIFQTIGLVRYISRLPDDWVGITLNTITMIAFVAISIGAFIQAR